MALIAAFGHLDLMTTHLFDPLGRGDVSQAIEVQRSQTGTNDGDRHGQLANAWGVAPIDEVEEHVGPQQEKQFSTGIFLLKMGQRVNRVMDPAEIGFMAAHSENAGLPAMASSIISIRWAAGVRT